MGEGEDEGGFLTIHCLQFTVHCISRIDPHAVIRHHRGWKHFFSPKVNTTVSREKWTVEFDK